MHSYSETYLEGLFQEVQKVVNALIASTVEERTKAFLHLLSFAVLVNEPQETVPADTCSSGILNQEGAIALASSKT